MVYRPEGFLRRIAKLEELAQDCRELPVTTIAEYERNKTVRYAAERLLVLAAETVIDILDYLLAARHWVASDSYEDVITNARANGLLSEELYGRLKGMGGLRNALTHQYLTISNEQTYGHFTRMRGLLPTLNEALRKLL